MSRMRLPFRDQEEKISTRLPQYLHVEVISRILFLPSTQLLFHYDEATTPLRCAILLPLFGFPRHETYLFVALLIVPSFPSSYDRQLGEDFIEEELKVSFSIGSLDDAKALKLLEKAKRKLAIPNTCWHRAYSQLFSSCSKIASNNKKYERLAWMLNECFQLDSNN